MKDLIIKVKNSGGLTSRSSAELVEEANHYHCHVTMKLDSGEECDLKSIMNVFAMPLIPPNTDIKIILDGEDEEEALKGFKKLETEFSF